MIATQFNSSNLRKATYNPFTAKLTVTFHTNAIYEYVRVPLAVYLRLVQADSHGGYFARHIRDRFSYRRIK